MAQDNTTPLGSVIHIDDERIQDHVGRIVHGSVSYCQIWCPSAPHAAA